VGCVRTNNEVSFFADDSQGLYIVCDGMGGHDGGEVASMTAISAVASCFRNRRDEIMGLPIRGQDRMLQQLIVDSITEANAAICFLADRSECFKDMGTTITLLAVHDGFGIIGHCGDSRAYRVGSRIELLTHDHTLETELRAQGMQGDGPSRYGHLLTRVLGRHDFAAPDMQTFRVAPGANLRVTLTYIEDEWLE
jgi:protein phosphatase